MKTHVWKETFDERLVTHTQEAGVKLIIIEHAPARVCRETGEQLFSPKTVRRIQAIIRGQLRPARMIETPVYEFAEAAA